MTPEQKRPLWQEQGFVGQKSDPAPDDAYSVRGVGRS